MGNVPGENMAKYLPFVNAKVFKPKMTPHILKKMRPRGVKKVFMIGGGFSEKSPVPKSVHMGRAFCAFVAKCSESLGDRFGKAVVEAGENVLTTHMKPYQVDYHENGKAVKITHSAKDEEGTNDSVDMPPRPVIMSDWNVGHDLSDADAAFTKTLVGVKPTTYKLIFFFNNYGESVDNPIKTFLSDHFREELANAAVKEVCGTMASEEAATEGEANEGDDENGPGKELGQNRKASSSEEGGAGVFG